MKAVLAIDLGASSGTAILTDVHNNKLRMTEVSRFSDYATKDADKLKWDLDKILEEILKAVKKAEELREYKYIAIDTWGVDFGLLDKDGKLLDNPYHYRDEHTVGTLDKVKKIIEPETIYEKTGIQIMEINTLFQLFSIKERELEIYNQAETLLLMPDLINYYLTGTIKTERTIASTTQLYNPKNGDWDYELIKTLGFKESLFTNIIDSGEKIGSLKPELTKELRVSEKEVIAVASHDTASAIFCTPYEEGKNLFLSSGTWSLIGTQLSEPLISDKTFKLNLSNETGANQKITLLKNITGLWLIQETKKYFESQGKNYSFSDLANLSKEAKMLDCYFDTDLPELTVPGNIPQKITSYAIKTNQEVPKTDGEIVRVIYENLALKYRTAYEELKTSTGHIYENLYIVGGGANADYLSQATANALKLKVTSGYSEATALGNSLIQMITSKIIKDQAEAEKLLTNSFEAKVFEPKNLSQWDRKFDRYKEVIELYNNKNKKI